MNAVVEILQSCLDLELMAVGIYEALASQAEEADAAGLWREIARDERRHVGYWQELLRLAEEGKIEDLLDDPSGALGALREVRAQAVSMQDAARRVADTETAMMMAARLEPLMMNPAFEVLFCLLTRESGDPSPEQDYEDHIGKFIAFFAKRAARQPHWGLMADLLRNTWNYTRRSARQQVQIRELQRLIPICSGCKKIRDDAGFWGHVEAYLGSRLDMKFSHGLCPDCFARMAKEI